MGDLKTWCVVFREKSFDDFLFCCPIVVLNLFRFFCHFLAKARPKLKSRYKDRVKAASDDARTIDNFNDLIDPQTLYRHFLGPEPSPFVLRAIEKEEKSKFCWKTLCSSIVLSICFVLTLLHIVASEMMTRFNQNMYAWIKAKKNEPLSSIG